MAYPTDAGNTYTTNVDNQDVIYSSDVNNLQTEVTALKTKVGVDGSATTTTHDYKLSAVTGSNKALTSGTSTQSVTGLTAVSPIISTPKITVGSDAVGDLHYTSNVDGTQSRLGKGTDNQILKMNGTALNWEDETVTVNASTTAAGIVELATAAQVTAGTATGETGAKLAVTPDALASSTPVFNASALTSVPSGKLDMITTDVTNYSSTAENTVVSYSLAGGVLGTNNAVKVTIHLPEVKGFNNGTVTFRFKYGATTLITKAFGAGSTFSLSGKIEFILAGAGTTGTQNGSIFASLSSDALSPSATTMTQYPSFCSQGTSSIDSTTSQTIAVTAQASMNTPVDGYLASLIVVEKIT